MIPFLKIPNFLFLKIPNQKLNKAVGAALPVFPSVHREDGVTPEAVVVDYTRRCQLELTLQVPKCQAQ